jgi:molybdopterin molybdotransferase
MISIEQAVEIVHSVAREKERPDRMPGEPVGLTEAVHRILREDIVAESDSPPFDKAIRDGFAVRWRDLATVPAILEIIGESRAGKAASVEVRPGSCCEIMTGAPLPAGADAVVMVEHTESGNPGAVRILRAVREGEGLLRRASEVRLGERILASGRSIQLPDIGALASFGKAEVLVSKKPRVAILATGDELVEVRETPDSGQIRNSNSYTLNAQVREAGAEPILLGIARDLHSDLREKIARGLENDILLVSGGVSMGKYDFVEEVFAEFGVRVLFDKVAMKPGKPTVFGHRGDTFVFGLPGNPVSTTVAFHMFVRPLIRQLLKETDAPTRLLQAQLEAPAKRDPERTAVVPASLRFSNGAYRIHAAPWKGSSDLAGLSRANALIVIPKGEGRMEAGEWAEFLSL